MVRSANDYFLRNAFVRTQLVADVLVVGGEVRLSQPEVVVAWTRATSPEGRTADLIEASCPGAARTTVASGVLPPCTVTTGIEW